MPPTNLISMEGTIYQKALIRKRKRKIITDNVFSSLDSTAYSSSLLFFSGSPLRYIYFF